MRANLLKLSKLILLLFALNAHAADELTDAADLQRLAATNPNEVIVLMISQENCGYCSRVKEDYLKPLMKSENHPPLRILHLDRSDKVVDFDGEKRSGSIIASKLGGRLERPSLLQVLYKCLCRWRWRRVIRTVCGYLPIPNDKFAVIVSPSKL